MTATTAAEGSITPPAYRHDPSAPLRPINWNRVSDEKDLEPPDRELLAAREGAPVQRPPGLASTRAP